MSEIQTIAVITGATRGIGLEVSRQLAQQGIQVILTRRDALKTQAVAHSLQQQGLPVMDHPLDVTDPDSVQELADFIKVQFGHLEILINNAGIFIDGHDSSILTTDIDIIRQTLETNTYGPLRVAQALIPLMGVNNYGRIVNVSSGMGKLTDMDGGYTGYRLSKTALNAITRILASELANTNILVNSVCPGWVKTDMGGDMAPKSVAEGADTIVWLATVPEGSPTGGFFRERQMISW